MATTSRSAARLWRWRSNPLRRRVDVVEAWIILAAWLCAVAGGLAAAWVTGSTAYEGYARMRAAHRPVPAVVVRLANSQATTGPASHRRVRATVRWTGTDGHKHTAATQVRRGASPGQRIRVWTDVRNHLTAEPLSPANALFQSAMVGLTAAGGAGVVVLIGVQGLQACLGRHRMRLWAADWEQADRRWGGTNV
ncbi:Rv1733c family protein [Streptomyces sediminimaris]|uniref:Rv1733c family protein n=1 Tax=Streptomyces sediminimaris TaxID=3383721 RepID=UPI00399BC821